MACAICLKPFVLSNEDDFDSDTKPHVCTTCGQSFSLKIQLKRHTLLHANGDPFTCINCSKNASKDESKSYNLRLAKKSDYTCEICFKNFSSKRMLLKHSNEGHIFERTFLCDDCPETFVTSYDLKKHASTHRIKPMAKKSKSKAETSESQALKSLSCPSCSKSFAYQACLDKHIKQCQSQSVDYSKPSKKRALDVDAHKSSKVSKKNNDEDSDKHLCNVCGKGFARKSAMEGHQFLHLKDIDSPDEYAPTPDFSDDSEDYADDPEVSKINIRKSYMCEKCNLVCFSQITLNKHMRNHKGSESSDEEMIGSKSQNRCKKCSIHFGSAEELNEHMSSVHAKTKSDKKEKRAFLCQSCTKTFRSERRLKRHEVIHDIERGEGIKTPKSKDFICDLCGKRFAGETCLKKHYLRHETGNGEITKGRKKKLKIMETMTCSFCNEEFVGRRGAYVKHMHAHTPEVCGICDERFVDRQGLREHCKVHVGTEEGRMFMECSQKALDAKNGVVPPEPKVEYIYLVLR